MTPANAGYQRPDIGEWSSVIRIKLANSGEIHPILNAYAIHRTDDVEFTARRGCTAEGIAEAVGRLGETITREAVDATLPRRAPTT
jgi:hypothetical protein